MKSLNLIAEECVAETIIEQPQEEKVMNTETAIETVEEYDSLDNYVLIDAFVNNIKSIITTGEKEVNIFPLPWGYSGMWWSLFISGLSALTMHLFVNSGEVPDEIQIGDSVVTKYNLYVFRKCCPYLPYPTQNGTLRMGKTKISFRNFYSITVQLAKTFGFVVTEEEIEDLKYGFNESLLLEKEREIVSNFHDNNSSSVPVKAKSQIQIPTKKSVSKPAF